MESSISATSTHLPRMLPGSQGGTLRNLIGRGAEIIDSLLPKSSASGINPAYQNIIDQQMELQRQMLLVSMQSNLEKTRHEIQMAPVRNIRVG